MKEFIEKLISKLEELTHDNPMVTSNYILRKDVISSVNELAEEYNNGWIPCSERLPEGNKEVLVCTNAGQIDVDYYGEYIKDFIGLKGTEQHAIAWQPLPVPFKKVGAV